MLSGISFADGKGYLEKDLPLDDRETVKEADSLFSASLYEKAASKYLNILNKLEGQSSINRFLYFRLGLAYFFSGHYRDAIGYFEKPETDQSYPEAPFFSGAAYNHVNDYHKAVPCFEEYLNQPSRQFEFEALLECGLSFFHLKKWDSAAHKFSSIPFQKNKTSLFILSRFYLARIAMLQSDFLKAEAWLNETAPYMDGSGLLEYEWAYLNGELYFLWKDYARAVDWYALALPKNSLHKIDWSSDTLIKLGTAALQAAENTCRSPQTMKLYLDKAEKAFKTLTGISSDEKAYIALAQCHLTKARFLNDSNAYALAEEILFKPQTFLSRHAQSQALLLRAQAGPTYRIRDQLYRQLTYGPHQDNPTYARGWLLKGLNDFEEAQALKNQNRQIESAKMFEQSIAALHKAFDLLAASDPKSAAMALKFEAYAFYSLENAVDKLAAFQLLAFATDQPFPLIHQMTDPDEIFYLKGIFASRLARLEMGDQFNDAAYSALNEGIRLYPKGKFADKIYFLLGTLHYQSGNFLLAEESFSLLASKFPDSSLRGDALFWQANAMEKMQRSIESVKDVKKRIYEEHPQSTLAPEAYFTFYTYRDYLQGDRPAIKHLHAFPEKFPDTPFLLNAYYLIGIDCKSDRKSPEGKWISKKNLTAAIDAFQQCETNFNRLFHEGHFFPEKMPYYTSILYRSILERALTNMAIAEDSQGAKRQIYLDYAEEVLRSIDNDFLHPEESFVKFLANDAPYSPYQEESTYWLAQCCALQGNQEEADRVFHQMLEKYHASRITKGYFLSKVCYHLGLASMNRRDFPQALAYFSQGEDAAKGKILTSDEKLDLWIRQSLCYQELKQWDETILILSKVINDDAISGLRIKAMYLRAEAYELQGRRELSRKQLEAASKKGGEWSLKAKQKLEQEYGYQ